VTGEFILKTNYYSKRKISFLAETTNTDRETLNYFTWLQYQAKQFSLLYYLSS